MSRTRSVSRGLGVVAVIALMASMHAEVGAQSEPEGLPDPRLPGLQRLDRASGGRTEATFVGSFPRAVFTEVDVPGEDPVARARAFLEAYPDLYGQEGDRLELVPWRRSFPVDVCPGGCPDPWLSPALRVHLSVRALGRAKPARKALSRLAIWIATPEGQMVEQADVQLKKVRTGSFQRVRFRPRFTRKRVLRWRPTGMGRYVLHMLFARRVADRGAPLRLRIRRILR